MDFLKDIDFTDPTIIAAVIALIGVIIGGVFLICGAFISRGGKPKVEPAPAPSESPLPSPPQPVIQPHSSLQSLHQIPPPDGDFIGREEELQELLDKVKQSGVHISGIRGMGGIGKTQLAYRLVEELKPQYPDAQIYLDLKGATEKDEQIPLKPAEALAHIIRSFEPEIALPEKVEELRPIFLSILENKKAILLMDNALNENQTEPLIPPKGSLLLITSRKNFSLPGMYLRELNTLPSEESIQLLLNISDRIGDHAKTIAKICGYLPLALNVAGKAMAVNPTLSPEEYIDELKNNEALEPVDRSLATSCKWLEEAERNYFYQLSVFPGSFDSRAAGAVWQLDEAKAKKSLSNLVNISLVEWDAETKRYHLHDLSRVFARKQLEDQKHYATQKQHAEHYLKVLEVAEALYEEGGGNVLAGLHLFDLEWENIETGQAWAATHSATDETATRLCNNYPNAGYLIFGLRQHPRERIQWREPALAASQKLKIRIYEGYNLGNLAKAYNDLGDYQKGNDYSEQALQIAKKIGDKSSEAISLTNLGNANIILGNNKKAIDYQKQALQIFQEIGSKKGEGDSLGNLGIIYLQQGDYQRGMEYYVQQITICKEIGDKRGEGFTFWNMSLEVYKMGDRARAIPLAQEALKIFEELGDINAEMVRKRLEEWKTEA